MKNKKKKSNNIVQLSYLKYNALKLRNNYQIPYKLCYEITKLDKDSSKEVILYLSQCAEHYLRIKGYYKKYPALEEQVNTIISEELEKLGL